MFLVHDYSNSFKKLNWPWLKKLCIQEKNTYVSLSISKSNFSLCKN